MPRDYKYKANFKSVAKCVLDKGKGKFLAQASLQDLRAIIPEGAEEHEDMLAIAANLYVANVGNLNGALLGTKESLHLYKKLAFKYVNLEHSSDHVIGVISGAKLSKFDINYKIGMGSEVLEESDVVGAEPFNVSISGFIWDSVAPGITKAIMESNDPESPEYMGISTSWEVSYEKYCIIRGSRFLASAEMIEDPELIEILTPRLKSRGGDGKDKDGNPIYELICFDKEEDGSDDEDSVVITGCALTMNPAGDVAGVVAKLEMEEDDEDEKEEDESSNKNILAPEITVDADLAANNEDLNKNISQIISQPLTTNVIPNRLSNMKVFKSLDDIKALTDDNAKEYALASVIPAIEATFKEDLQKSISEFEAKANEAIQAKASAEQEALDAKAKVADLEGKLTELTTKLDAIASAQLVAEANQKYSSRLEYFDNHYELTDEDRVALASRLKDISDEAFESFKDKEFAVFAKEKNKEVIAAKKAAAAPATQVAVASVAPAAVADAALATATATTTQIPDATQPAKSLLERMKEAFGGVADGITITAK